MPFDLTGPRLHRADGRTMKRRTSSRSLHDRLCATALLANGWRLKPGRAVVINGFWRSGTTWLQELLMEGLDAIPVFEPFMEPAGYIYECLPEIRPGRRDHGFINTLMPFARPDFEGAPRLRRLVNRALRGQLPRAHVASIGGRAPTLRECMRTRVVVKFVRGALCLREVARDHEPTLFHIYRDPRAVVLSLKTLDQGRWARGSFNGFSVKASLLEVEDGRAAYFSRWKADIEAVERTNDYGRLAAYYCLTERFLEESFSDGSERLTRLCYEELVQGGPEALDKVLEGLSVDPGFSRHRFDHPSDTDFGWKGQVPRRQERLDGWRDRLASSDRELIEEVVATFGMESRLR